MTPARWSLLAVAVLTLDVGLCSGLGEEATSPSANASTRLRREHAQFLALPPGVQQRLRRVDREFAEEDSESRTRYLQLLQRYSDWIDRLPTEQRRLIDEAPSTPLKLQKIKEIKEQQWKADLPKADRDRIDAAKTDEERQAIIAELREQQRQDAVQWQMTLAALGDRRAVINRELMAWRKLVLDKMKGEEKRARLKDWETLRNPQALESLHEQSLKLGVKVPDAFRHARMLLQQDQRMVDLPRLYRFMRSSEAIRQEFEPRLKDPEQREQALLDLVERYWKEHPEELQRLKDNDELIKKRRQVK